MTLAEEKALLARLAKAGAGEMLNIHDVKAAYDKAIGHPTSDSTVYNLLHRFRSRAFRRDVSNLEQLASRVRPASGSVIALPAAAMYEVNADVCRAGAPPR